MAYFLQLVFAGVALGCIYALIGLGFTIIYKASEVINFAQGDLLLVGAYIVAVGVFEWHLGFFLALLLGILVTIIIGLLFERLVLRQMIGRPVFSILMTTIGLGIVLRTLVIAIWGSNPLPAATPFQLTSGFTIGGVHFESSELWTIIVTAVVCAALFCFFRFTKYGLAMRATAIDQEAALAMGINIRNVYAIAWGIAAAIATIGGVFLAINSIAIDPTLGNIALFAFPAIILGGIDSVSGAVLGGIMIGLTVVITAGYESHFANILGAGFHEIAPYLLMILVLLIRPYGIFGTRKVERI
ncbi:MAG TPA: branched-chain amino acid ABC transporter permease [Ktedonobacteraceae bacterium]|nr:branched-chain amino acid ABC transporter permease [Ktedonobacteraceae bacterium]